MYIYEKRSRISCTLEALYAFHSDTKNLKAVTPPNISVALLNPIDEVKEGDILDIKTKKFFFSIPWKIEITQATPPHKMIDTALKSPFTFWEHHHIFRQKEDGCELKDIVFYEIPYGFVGKIFSKLIALELEAMFTYRHAQTKKILEAKDTH